MKRNKKGFTLAELLIVVAIIAVLVAVAIPVFSTQLEKSREATDLANMRSAYAEAVAESLTSEDGGGISSVYTLIQTDPDEGLFDVGGYDSLSPDLYLAVYNAGVFDDGRTTDYVVFILPTPDANGQIVYLGSLEEALDLLERN